MAFHEGRPSQDGVVSGRAVDHKECYVLSDLLGVVSHHHG